MILTGRIVLLITCSCVLQELLESVRESCSTVNTLPAGFVRDLIVQQVGTDVGNKTAAVNLSVATQLSDRVLDEVTDALQITVEKLVSSRLVIAIPGLKNQSRDPGLRNL